MDTGIGIALAFVAMLCWGFGDFLIQKSARKVGDWETLFIISIFGMVVLAPFSARSTVGLISDGGTALVVLIGASVVLLIAALLQFESLRKGKIAVVEPTGSLEIPSAAFLAFVILGERMTASQSVWILVLLVSLVLVGLRGKKLSASILFEKGLLLAICASIMMGGANFMFGWAGRVSDPVMVNFFTDTFLTFATGAYLLYKGRFAQVFFDIRHGYKNLLPMAISDKVAWLAFALAMTLAPIGIATALSQSYVIVAVLLGLVVGKERLHAHQKVGLVGALIAAIALAMTVAGA